MKQNDLVGKKAWLMFHTFAEGHQCDLYADEGEAWDHAAQIALDYIDSTHEIFPEALAAYRSKDYRKVLKLVSVPSVDDHCNVEVSEITIQ